MRIVFKCDDVREEVIEAVRKSSYDDIDSLVDEYGWYEVIDAIFYLGGSDYSEYFSYWLWEKFNDECGDIVGDFFYAKEIVEREEKAQ